jgi:pimeloyl-ACP methyl ester carboxylesterase/predicted glycosyltransferase
MRARAPDDTGFIVRDGVKVPYEVFGTGEPTIMLLPSWAIVTARQWKAQVHYLARHFRVVTVEGRGNGGADRPHDPAAYADREYIEDAVAVLDAIGVARAVVVGLSLGARRALQLAARHPQRVSGVVAIDTTMPRSPRPDFDMPKPAYAEWDKDNRHYWLADYRGWLEFFFSQVFTDPHSTKHIEDGVGWGLETDAETLLCTVPARHAGSIPEIEDTCRAVRCPVLVIHGDQDAITPYITGEQVAEWTGGELVRMAGVGHAPPMRQPVATNLLLREFAQRVAGPPPGARRVWAHALSRRRRALFVSSPIGLGHARRDLAIADELRTLHPDLEIDWLAQEPVTQVLRERGERVHPASTALASESAHIDAEAGEHDLHVFQALRRMDEILVANFMVFADVVRAQHYDLWVADEGWDIDHFLHENPELKRSPFAWLTDFVGWLPQTDDEAATTADYNAEMVEHIARYPLLRDRSVFVGDPGDLVPDSLGPGLPTVAEWTQAHFAFAGYITGYAPPADREALRAELGWRPDERVCVVAVGGSAVGTHLLRRVVAAYPDARRAVAGLRIVVVTGPRIDPAAVPAPAGVQVRGYVPELHRELAACDLAVVQGGLTTAMELVAARRPFLYVPLRGHFEQQRHVPHRLARHRAGRRIDYADLTPDRLAAAISEEIDRPIDYLPVPTDGARRAAALLSELM